LSRSDAPFVKVAEMDGFEPGTLRAVLIGDYPIALANVDGAIYAFDEACPHLGASLAESVLDGPVIWCYLHGARFDVRTGEKLPTYPVRSDLPTHRVRVEGNDILVQVPIEP